MTAFDKIKDKIKDILDRGPDNWEERLASHVELTSPSGKTFKAKWRGNNRTKAKKLGIFFYPKLEGEVVQDLEAGSARYPVVVGAGWRNYVFVLVETDAGLTGLGEASLGGQTNAVLGELKDLEPLLVGADPLRIEHLWQQVYRHAFWHGGVTLMSALAGIEVAFLYLILTACPDNR